jgi:prevent-host-death family protein
MTKRATGKRWGSTREIEASAARQNFREIVEASSQGRRCVITRNGRPIAALVSLRDLDLLMKRDSAIDHQMTQARGDEAALPFDEFVAKAAALDATARAQAVAEIPTEGVESLAAELVKRVIADVAPQVAEETTEVIIEQMKEHLGGDLDLSFGEEARMKEIAVETVYSRVLHLNEAPSVELTDD